MSANLPVTPGASQSAYAGGQQDAFIAKIDNTNLSCSYTLDRTSHALTAAAGSSTVDVTATSGCVWVASTSDQWITVTSGASGIGTGTVGFQVLANNSTAPRTGTITIAGQAFTVTQPGASCSYSIAPQGLTFDSTGGISNVSVTAPQGCTWTSLSNATWININQGTNGNGPGLVQYAVQQNAGATRTGTLTIAGQTFTVTQGGAGCTYTLSTTNQAAALGGGAHAVNVASNSSCAWTAASNSSWIVITSGASGSGN